MSIEIKRLSFSYNKKDYAIENISLNINSAGIIGIAGHTGCGKSTLVQLIAGLLTPSEGTVYIDGENIFDKKYKRSELRKKLGIVFQYPETQLFEQSVEKDIAFALKKSGLSAAQKKERIKWAMELMRLDYGKMKDKSPLALSGGEKRKAAIAGVIVIRPKYLILDEPIAGLDPLSRDDFMQVLLELKRQGTTVIIVSHNADCLAEYADRVIVMNHGKIVMDSPPNEVYSKVDELKAMSLGTCNVKEISYLLCEKGISISNDVLKYNDLVSGLVSEFGDEYE